ncbi:MBOAT family O-acyltransferase [Roseivirga sp.]|uniref:MBOAT family O-acyltransferase n=1 Tax=Roseivirga sp. TaxID=1964215 RepID=UPI003B8CD6A7
MSFTTLDFAVFVSVVFLLYWFLLKKNVKWQNTLILIASYVFYGWWDWKFLSLIIISSLVDYLIGVGLGRTEHNLKRKILLYSSLATNLGILFLFKYFDFFLDAFKVLFSIENTQFQAIDMVLPVGISFYTLQTLSYTIDVYNKKIKPHHDFISFFAFVSFFPQLVAGPIERAANLLPQFGTERVFSYEKAADGMRQILWGLFKKLFVANHCAIFVNEVFTSFHDHQGSTLFIAAIAFTIQVYCDFSGYSDMAIGLGRILGFNLTKNFDYPLFSRDISELWNKWHITLISWLRDYVYIPLGGGRKGKTRKVFNILAIFALSGLWHGAHFTFVLWGVLHGIALLLHILWRQRRHSGIVAEGRLLPSYVEAFQIIRTFLIFTVINVIFRIDTVDNGLSFMMEMFSVSFFNTPYLPDAAVPVGCMILFNVEWLQRNKNHGLEMSSQKTHFAVRWGIYFTLILIILFFAAPGSQFFYFQF